VFIEHYGVGTEARTNIPNPALNTVFASPKGSQRNPRALKIAKCRIENNGSPR